MGNFSKYRPTRIFPCMPVATSFSIALVRTHVQCAYDTPRHLIKTSASLTSLSPALSTVRQPTIISTSPKRTLSLGSSAHCSEPHSYDLAPLRERTNSLDESIDPSSVLALASSSTSVQNSRSPRSSFARFAPIAPLDGFKSNKSAAAKSTFPCRRSSTLAMTFESNS